MANRLIAGGAVIQVWIQHPEQGMVPVGLATGASYDEDWSVNPANVLGFLGPIDYDSQGYSCSLNLSTFRPMVPGGGPWPDGGTIALHDFLPTRQDVQASFGKPGEFDVMQFLNIATGEVANRFRRVMLASNGTQISPNSYITANMRLLAVERVQ